VRLKLTDNNDNVNICQFQLREIWNEYYYA